MLKSIQFFFLCLFALVLCMLFMCALVCLPLRQIVVIEPIYPTYLTYLQKIHTRNVLFRLISRLFEKLFVLLRAKVTRQQSETNMINLAHPNIQDFNHVEAPQKNTADKQPMHSYFKVKPGSYTIPRTKHKITKLPHGIL